ncbi:MAG: nuclear transport factor 2 family protein [Bacteroidetes bacterium]|nr:nuclear transport factor 2 family protein [Bacteroidota bacterium]
MKKITLLLAALSICIFVTAQSADEDDAIKKLILTAYVDGLQNKGDLDQTRNGFYPGFDLLMFQRGMINKFPIYNWITYAEMEKQKDPSPLKEDELTSCEFEFIDITGNAAVAKIHLSKGGKKIFTDYLSLYEFEDGWKIVSKIYYKIPE